MEHEFHAHHAHHHSHAHGPLATISAILIAIFTVCLAGIAWRAAVASYTAQHADYEGIQATVSDQEVRTLAAVEARAHAQMYASYRRYDETAGELEQEIKTAKGAEADALKAKMTEASALVDSKLKMFPNKFMDRDTGYDIKRDAGEYLANEGRARDLEPEPHFERAEAFRQKHQQLLLGDVFMAVAMVFLTLVESFEGAIATVMFALGALIGGYGIVYSIMMEMAR